MTDRSRTAARCRAALVGIIALAASAPALAERIAGGGWVGCRGSAALTALMDHARAGEMDEYRRLLGAHLLNRECRRLAPDTVVVIVGSGSGIVKIRVRSDGTEWWISRDAVK